MNRYWKRFAAWRATRRRAKTSWEYRAGYWTARDMVEFPSEGALLHDVDFARLYLGSDAFRNGMMAGGINPDSIRECVEGRW